MKKILLWLILPFLLFNTVFASTTTKITTAANSVIDLKFGGKLDFQAYSIPVLTAVAWALDGFNPCALFILLFLISVVLTSWDRKKLMLFWWTFILVSGLTYFWILAFLLYWVSSVPQYYKIYIQTIIWTIAIIFWLVSLKEAFKKKKAWCDVMDDKKRNFFFKKIKIALEHKSTFLALSWIAIVAFLINFLEMFCSVWIPITYITILSNQNFWMLHSLAYLLLYVLFFLIIHIIIYTVSVVSFKVVAVSNRYTKIINIIWWLLMIFVWLSMIFKPELLTIT